MHEDRDASRDANAIVKDMLGSMEMAPSKEVPNVEPVRSVCCTTVVAFQRSTEGAQARKRVNEAARQLAETANKHAAQSACVGMYRSRMWWLCSLHRRPGCWVVPGEKLSLEGAPGAKQ